MIINCFDPIIDKKSQILVLGTMPGAESLNRKCYYGNPKNHFWDIFYRILDPEWEPDKLAESISSIEKKKFLLKNRVALWDVIESCERKGSSDKGIKNETLNDLNSFFLNNPQIQTVCFNGGKAQTYFLKKYSFDQFPNQEFHKLNSTSTSNRNNTFKILNEWKETIKP